ncbi:MAG TPA: prolyl oligopeptidase family serine peptidase [Minicystis sp.]|nr:prolyl oligopeptidase family serine peptidase [Minicystis sp.]
MKLASGSVRRGLGRGLACAAAAALLGVVACEETPEPVAPAPPPAAPAPAPAPAASNDGLPPIPETPKRPVVTDYGSGIKVSDDYRWLENDDAEEKAWSDAETKRARAYLDGYPGRQALRDRIASLKKGRGVEFFYFIPRGKALFAWKAQPPAQQPMLVVMASPDAPDAARVVVDPNKIDPTGKTAMDFYVPSLDGKLVAVSLSKGGSEAGDLHVFEVATGKELPDVIEHVNGGTAGGSAAWNAKGTGFYYTRYPRKGERAPADMDFYQQVYFHELGKKPDADTYVLGKDLPRIAEIALATREDGKYVLAEVKNGDGGEVGYWMLPPQGKAWKQLAKFEDGLKRMWFGRDDQLYALSTKGAPKGKIVRTPAAKPAFDKATVVVPEGDATIRGVQPTATKLYVAELLGGPSRIRILDLKGKELGMVALPNVPSVGQMARLDKDEILYSVESYLEPPAWYRFSGAGAPKKTPMVTKSPVDYGDAEVLRETCTSKDGTKVPVSIILKKGAPRDGARPTVLNGYGGYGVNLEPFFWDVPRVLLDKGGVFAVANLRGGGEYGEAWHKAGMLEKKQNVFDDFVACAKRLVELKLTSKDHLAILGGSNGGLLMGAAFTQHPDLFKAVVSEVGIYDMLRSEDWPNGAFNVTEFGTVKNPSQLAALYAYSPYHHVVDGTQYPAILLTTGVNDPRVAPWQSRKMAARLQASGTKAPVLLLTRDSGHGIGNSLEQEIDDTTDIFSFVFRTLGVE